MDASILDSKIVAPDMHPTGPDAVKIKKLQSAVRRSIFRFLLAGVGKPGDRVVDLGAGPCIFARVARDSGFAVTAVDARTVLKPTDEELGSIRFIHRDVRNFEVDGFDIIVFLGLFYHFEIDDQLRILRKCARTGVPVILETQVHMQTLVPAAKTDAWARRVISHGMYEGVVSPELNTPMSSIGNRESFWHTEPSLLRIFEDAGFKTVSIIDPVFLSQHGARRYYLLNCSQFALA